MSHVLWTHFIRWLLFSVLVALVPIGVVLLKQYGESGSLNLAESISQGQLLLITACLSGTAIGELAGSNSVHVIKRIAATAGAVLVLMASTLYFTEISIAISKGKPLLTTAVLEGSLWIFVLGLFSSASCLLLSKEGVG